MFMYDSTMLLLIPAAILAFYAQYKVKSTFEKYSRTSNRRGFTGADVAQQLLANAGVHNVRVERTSGNLTDHYDPRSNTLRLSDAVYNSTSLAALGVAAHETGHAIQHEEGYLALSIRNTIVPVVSFSSQLATPLIFIGILLSMWGGPIGVFLMDIGIVLFAAVVLFQLITLPVEFNASRRAINMLTDNNILSDTEIVPAKKVLNAAALTYVAAAAVAIANLLRFLALSNRRRN